MELSLREEQGIRLAIEGCGHGTLHAIYASIEEACKRKGWPGVDLLIIGGDFQSVRNAYDLKCVSMPPKYRTMGDFHEYYSGQRTAPYLTIFAGGNHEASNYLFELYYGGWVAPNIFYIGAANVLRLGPVRIAGMSGIWKGYNYRKPHYERLPYNESDLKSIYHVRELDIRKLLQIRTQVDIGVSHDWPKGVEWNGNWKQLFRFKKHLEEDARNGQLGNVAAQQVMERLRPKYWFSAHLHCKYAAVVEHDKITTASETKNPINGGFTKNEDEIDLDQEVEEPKDATTVTNSDEIDLELDDGVPLAASVAPNEAQDSRTPVDGPILSAEEARAALPEAFRRPARPEPEPMEHPPEITNARSHFLALDKCLPNKDFLQLMVIPTDEDAEPKRPLRLEYDREWLAITRAFALIEPLVVGDSSARVPPARSQSEYERIIDEQREWVDDHIADGALEVPENFEVTAPVYEGGNWNLPQYDLVEEYPNSQTALFCEMLQIRNVFAISAEERAARLASGPRPDPEAQRFSVPRGRGGFGHGHGRGRATFRGRGRGGRQGQYRNR